MAHEESIGWFVSDSSHNSTSTRELSALEVFFAANSVWETSQGRILWGGGGRMVIEFWAVVASDWNARKWRPRLSESQTSARRKHAITADCYTRSGVSCTRILLKKHDLQKQSYWHREFPPSWIGIKKLSHVLAVIVGLVGLQCQEFSHLPLQVDTVGFWSA